MCIKKILSVSLILSLFLLSSLAIAGQKGPVAAQNAKILAYATEAGAETQDKGVTLWRNEFQSTAGIVSATLLANDDTLGGKSCILADDFTVPAGEIWTLDTIRVYMFWYKKATDSIRITLYPDAGGFPDEYSVLNTFSVKVTMPAALTLYTININVVAQNIVLPEATYWLSAVGIHNTGTMAVDTCLTLWNRKDTLLGTYTAQCMDSIGAHYTPYPTPWLGIWFTGENTENSARFTLKGAKATAINTNNQPKSRVSAFAYPNPASDNITFQLNNPAVRYIQIYDMKGKLLQTVSARSNRKKVHINALTNGIYMYQLLDASKKSVDRGRFSVSK